MKQMTKDTITAGVIGTLATYLPFWQWDGAQVMGAVALSVVTWIILVAMEPEPNKKDPEELGLNRIRCPNGQNNLSPLYCRGESEKNQ